MKTFKFILRAIFSPFIFLGATIAVFAGLIFPTTMLIIMSFVQLLAIIFFDILSLVLNSSIQCEFTDDEETFIQITNSKYINVILGITPLLWVQFFVTYKFLFKPEDFSQMLKKAFDTSVPY